MAGLGPQCSLQQQLRRGLLPAERRFAGSEPVFKRKSEPAVLRARRRPVPQGNLLVTGNLQPANNANPAIGLVAQNMVYLSDQQSANNTSLTVNGTIQSLSQNVQWAGFINGVNQNNNGSSGTPGGTVGAAGNYFIGQTAGGATFNNGAFVANSFVGLDGKNYSTLNTKTAAAPGSPLAALPQQFNGVPLPVNEVTLTKNADDLKNSGTFNLKGSIISPFLDIEGSFVEASGNGGTTDNNGKGNFIGYANQNTVLSTAGRPVIHAEHLYP